MVEGKLYKTKLCMLYQRGRCPRQHCNFAHGSAELRRSFNGRHEYRGGGDLRERLDRIRSPSHRSHVRGDPEGRHSFRRGRSRSLERKIERNHRKRKHWDGYSDRMSDDSDDDADRAKNRKRASSEAKIRANEKLREIHAEIKKVKRDKMQLGMDMEDKISEISTLSSKRDELEMQLSKEREDAKRSTAKIKKFIEAHNRHLQLQEELKRSHAQLQKLGEQLDAEALGLSVEDDSRINALNDSVNDVSIPLDEGQTNHSPLIKKSRLLMGDHDPSNQVNERDRVEKHSRQSGNRNPFSNSKKPEAEFDANDETEFSAYEDRPRRGIKQTGDVAASVDKVTETGFVLLPSTGIAAHAMDEDAEVHHADDKFQGIGMGSTHARSAKMLSLTFPPPPLPSVLPTLDLQYKGDDETVDIDGLDEASVYAV